MRKFKLAICQIRSVTNKIENLERAWSMLQKAKTHGAQVCVLGEMFACPYKTSTFMENSESVHEMKNISNFEELRSSKNPIVDFLQFASKKLDIFLVGGSYPQLEDGKLYNTCLIFENGSLLARHDKVHLFDIDIPNKFKFKESEVLSPGNNITFLKTKYGNFGFGICYDIRFPLYSMALRQKGAEVLFFPSIFGMVTGPIYFHNVGIARALDTQCYVVLGSSSKENESFAHSCLIDPHGKIVETLGLDEGLILQDVDLEEVHSFRTNIPYTEGQIRPDLYKLEHK